GGGGIGSTGGTGGTGGSKRYCYYVCLRAKKHGHHCCPYPSLAAYEIESFVVDEIKAIGSDSQLCDQVLKEAQERLAEQSPRAELDRESAVSALREFGSLWDAMSPKDQRELVQLLVERVAYGATGGQVTITFRPTGIRALSEQCFEREEEVAI
ncbi:MAG: zinc ribbon domain-containing protein, partial [Firmicutes bacterium]|nr:zinc ribbon domain-containing protein [Bacillota bacterium]